MNRARNPHAILALTVGFILIIAVITALLAGNRGPAHFASGSREATVQAYLDDVINQRNSSAARYFSSSSKCTASDLDTTSFPAETSVDLKSADVTGTTATIHLIVGYPNGGPFGQLSTEEKAIRLVLENGQWKIDGVPWPLWNCGVVNK